MNIEAAVMETECETCSIPFERRGHSIDSEMFTAITEPLSKIYAIPDHMHALANMLGDGLVLQMLKLVILLG